jgi:hypothetical protein
VTTSASALSKQPASSVESPSRGRTKPKPAAPAATAVEPIVEEDDYLADLPLAPSIRRTKKKTSKRARDKDLLRKLMLGIGAAACTMALVIWLMSSGDDVSLASNSASAPASSPNTNTDPTTAAEVAPPVGASVSKPPAFENWQTFADEFKSDPDLVFYFTFSGDGDGGDVVRSQATKPKFGSMNAKVFGAKWKAGRFPKKKCLHFSGNKSNQYVQLSDSDSNLCNFTTPFSIGVWFRAENPKSQSQVLISKGDDSWRMQRTQLGETLQLAANNTFYDAVAKKSDPTKGKPTNVNSLSSIDDGKWHFGVGVYDLQSKKKSLHLYLDGRPEGIVELDRMQPSKHPVCIGANSERLKSNDPRIWGGSIDEVFLLNRALTVNDVARMYEAGRPPE